MSRPFTMPAIPHPKCAQSWEATPLDLRSLKIGPGARNTAETLQLLKCLSVTAVGLHDGG